MKNKIVLLTGAAGFIGFHTAKLLIKSGYYVVGIDNMNDYYNIDLKNYRLEQLDKKSFCFYKIDVENKKELSDLFDKFQFESVLNLAARAGVRPSMDNPFIYVNTNLVGCLNILEEMRARNIKKLVQASTSSVYAGHELPYVESLPINTPISPYAVSKRAAELMAYTYHQLYGIDVTIVRYFTVYGPAGRPDMAVYRIIKSIVEDQEFEMFGDGSQSRDFTYVEDIARGNLAALKDVGYEIINLGGGNNPIALTEIIAFVEKKLSKNSNVSVKSFHSTDVKSTCANIEKAKKILGWEPETPLEEGLKRSIDWYLENRVFCKNI